MSKHLCIHGHFYQPPRENPWIDDILPEGSAAPLAHWNERILKESYAPLAWARRMDAQGRITELVNCYEWMSFNFGPTLLTWAERSAPETYARILEADRASLARLGHGNALAQVYHHQILPLATAMDRKVEIGWAIADFRVRFGRSPEGFWLSETAVDLATLDELAGQGVLFTILAPRQAREVAPLGSGDWKAVDEHGLDIGQPYLCRLPSGRDMAVFFYHGDLSQAVAFERLLEDGERFWTRLSSSCSHLAAQGRNSLLSIATDGETYGHHFTFGEMALAFVLGQARVERDEITLTNYARFLRDNPPQMEARLHDPSSWSCAHGVERWRSDCGCTTGGPAEWNQQWRAPLRSGLEAVKKEMDTHFLSTGQALFHDPEAALLDFGSVLAGSSAEQDFADRHFRPALAAQDRTRGWKLLVMEQWALASFASCAWFFEELSRIEPLNGLTFAMRAMELFRETTDRDLTPILLQELEKARSNIPSKGTGRELYEREVAPRRLDTPRLCALALLLADASGRLPQPGQEEHLSWPGVSLVLTRSRDTVPGGTVSVSWRLIPESEELSWTWKLSEAQDVLDSVFTLSGEGWGEVQVIAAELPLNGRQAVAMERIRRSEAELWELSGSLMFRAAPLFPPFQEGQRVPTLNEEWLAFWPALAVAYVRGMHLDSQGAMDRPDLLCANQRDCLVRFLAEHGASHPGRKLAMRKLEQECLELLDRTPPSLSRVEGMLERAGEIGLERNWWLLQNRLWNLALNDSDAGNQRLAAILKKTGFA